MTTKNCSGHIKTLSLYLYVTRHKKKNPGRLSVFIFFSTGKREPEFMFHSNAKVQLYDTKNAQHGSALNGPWHLGSVKGNRI